MNGLLCVVQLICHAQLFHMINSELVQRIYKKSSGNNYGILKEIPLLNVHKALLCAAYCLQRAGCESFTQLLSVCQLQMNGYGEWVGLEGKSNMLLILINIKK